MTVFFKRRAPVLRLVSAPAAWLAMGCSEIAQPTGLFVSIEPLQAAYLTDEHVIVRIRNIGPAELKMSSCNVTLQRYAQGRWEDVPVVVAPEEEILCPSILDVVLPIGSLIERQAGPYPLPSLPSGTLCRYRFNSIKENSQQLTSLSAGFSQPFLAQ